VYGSADPGLGYTLSEPISVTGALARAGGEDVGTYAINLGALASTSTNYVLSLSATPVTFAITAKTVTVTPNSGQSKVYGSADPALGYTLSEPISVTGTLARAGGEDVGAYAINLGTLASTSANYVLSLSAAPVTFAITAKTVTVTPNSGQSKVYGSADPALGYALSEPISVTGALARAVGEDVGAYAINLGTLASTSANYVLSLASTPVTFAITAKTVTVTPSSGQSKVYGSADPGLGYALSEPISVTGALARAGGEDVGAYAINLGTLASASANYVLSLSATPVTFAITAKTVTVTATSGQSKVYSGNAANRSGAGVFAQ
jgi:histone H3/H4